MLQKCLENIDKKNVLTLTMDVQNNGKIFAIYQRMEQSNLSTLVFVWFRCAIGGMGRCPRQKNRRIIIKNAEPSSSGRPSASFPRYHALLGQQRGRLTKWEVR